MIDKKSAKGDKRFSVVVCADYFFYAARLGPKGDSLEERVRSFGSLMALL